MISGASVQGNAVEDYSDITLEHFLSNQAFKTAII